MVLLNHKSFKEKPQTKNQTQHKNMTNQKKLSKHKNKIQYTIQYSNKTFEKKRQERKTM